MSTRVHGWRLGKSLLAILASLSAVPAALAGGLDTFQGQWPEAGLTAALATPATPQVEQGADLQLRLSSRSTMSIAIALEGPQHRVRLHVLHRRDSGDQLIPGSDMLFPDLAYGEMLYADLPVGPAEIWVIAADNSLFKPADGAGTPVIEDEAVLVRQIEAARAAGSAAHVTVARVPVEVIAPSSKEFVSKQDFVSFYAVRTRSVQNANRGFRIGFKENSAELDDWSRRQLEAVGAGMRDPQLAGYRFSLEGHTDDIGTDAYNDALSLRRAAAVRDFLEHTSQVSAARLSVSGLGKRRPAVQGTSDAARAENRRVVIRRVDSDSAPE